MTHETHPEVINRLKRAHGHLASTIAMIEGGRSCLEVAQQMHAVIKALEGTRGKTPGNDLCIVSNRSRISLNLKS
jgi:DNA-binding FrmR family transcriptional regulator